MNKLFYTTTLLLLLLLVVQLNAQTWSTITAPVGVNGNYLDIDFIDANNGVVGGVTGADVAFTSNGGTSWTNSTNSSGTMSVDMVDVNSIFSTGGGGSGNKTLNGGATWGGKANASSNHSHGGIRMATPSIGWELAGNRDLYKTTNGANSWSLVGNFGGAGTTFLKAFVLNTTTAFWPTGVNRAIIRTLDGTNWTTIYTTAAADVICIDCINANECWAGLDNGTVIKTTNASAATPTWTTHSTGASFFIRDIDFISANEGWIVGNGGVIRYTNDGGLNWTNQTSGTTQNLFGLSMINASVGYASGANRTLLKFDNPLPPEINLLGNSTSITDGDTDADIADHSHFGSVVSGNNLVRTYTIDNSAGTGGLTISSIGLSGTQSGDFVVGGITLPATVSAGNSTTFTLTFTPSLVGTHNATVTINNNDADEAAYDFAVQGQGSMIHWTTGGGGSATGILNGINTSITGTSITNAISNGSSSLFSSASNYCTAVATTDRLHANHNGNGATWTITFASPVTNPVMYITGLDDELNFSETPTKTSGNRAVVGNDLTAGGKFEGMLTFLGTHTSITFTTVDVTGTYNGGDNWDFTFAIINSNEINVQGNSVSIVDGDATPDLTDDTDFGSTTSGTPVVKTYTIQNQGSADLNLSTIVASGTNAADFTVGGITLPAVVTGGNSTTFTVSFDPSSSGTKNATITINNDDCNEAVYDYDVTGLGIFSGPSIAITEWLTNPNGSNTDGEWVELYNYGATPVDIQNWTIEDEDIESNVITINSHIIPSNGYVIIAKGKTAFENEWLNGCSNNNVLNVSGLTLGNGSDEIIIKDASNNVVWSVAYRNDETLGRATHYTEAPNFSTNVWGSKASTGIRRAGNDVTTGTLGYQRNNATADPNVMTSTTGDMGSPFNGTLVTKDIVRGDVLDFDGTNDYVSIPSNAGLRPANNFTIEAWFKTNDPNVNQIIFKHADNGGGNDAYILRTANGVFRFGALNNNGPTAQNILGTTNIVANTWYHVAGVYDNSELKIYVNGVLESAKMASGNVAYPLTTSVNIGRRGGSFSPNSLYLDGSVDEIRFWNIVRTEQEIRENMHLTLGNCQTGLIAYYQMNDGTGSSTLTDKSGNNNHGTLTNMDPATDWVTSGVNVGNDGTNNSNSQTITNIPIGLSTQNFNTANLSMDLATHSAMEDITVTYQEFTPNGITGVDGVNIIQNPMWTVNKSIVTTTLVADYTFTFSVATFSSTDPKKYRLYHRTMGSDGDWTKIAVADVITATTAKFTGISLTGQFMVVQESEAFVSDVRGNMYDFDGVNDYVRLPLLFDPAATSNFTIECWVKPNKTNAVFVQQQDGTGTGRSLLSTINNGRMRSVLSGSALDGSTLVPLNEWHHMALTYDGTSIRLYLNGQLEATSPNRTLEASDGDFLLGVHKSLNQFRHRGTMDEVRFWNVTRSQNEIRENMHLTLKGNETGLLAYYQFNNDDPTGTVNGVKDALGTNHGTTVNMASTAYLASEVAVAGGTSDRVTIGAGGIYTFPNTDVSIEFGANTPSGEIVVARLETEKPHGWETIGNDVDNEYFVINNYGSNQTFDPLIDISFNRMSYVSPLDVGLAQAASPLQLYKRADNAFGATWGTSFGGADNATSGTNAMISYDVNNNLNSFSQIVLVNNALNSDLPVELMRFDANRINSDKVQLDWSTASELNNQGFYIERMLEIEGKFETIGFVEGIGTTSNVTNYQFIDENSYNNISYYRLRQVDFDGTTSYSDIKAVAGNGHPNNNTQYIDVSIYPNPVYKELKVRFNQLPKEVKSATIQIMNINGQILHDFVAGIQSYQVLEIEAVNQLTPAIYLLSIQLNNGEKILQKFIKK